MAYLEGIKTTVKPTVWAPNTIYFVLQGNISETYITDNSGNPKPVGNTDLIQSLLDQYENQRLSIHLNDRNNPHGVTKSQVGLFNVDNTSDINKPISTATQTYLDGKVDDSQVLTNVPAGAVFTDTVYTLPFADNSANWNTAFSWGNPAGLYASTAQGVLADNSVQLTGQTTQSIEGKLNIVLETSFSNFTERSLIVQHKTTATPAIGIGTGIDFKVEHASNLIESIAQIDAIVTHNFRSGALSFRVSQGSTPLEAMRLDYLGRLGIGTTTPTEKLHVNGNVKATSFIGSGSQLTGVASSAQGASADTAFSWGDHSGLYSLLGHTHTIANITNLQTSLDGKVDDGQVLTNVPAGAVFTDTVYTLPFADNSTNWNTAFSWGNHAGLYASTAQGVLADNSVQLTGNQTIIGSKTFNAGVVIDNNRLRIKNAGTNIIEFFNSIARDAYFGRIVGTGIRTVNEIGGGQFTIKDDGTFDFNGNVNAEAATFNGVTRFKSNANQAMLLFPTLAPISTNLAFQVTDQGGVAKYSITWGGNSSQVGSVTAASFIGNGSTLTGVATAAQGTLADNSLQLTGETSQTIEGNIITKHTSQISDALTITHNSNDVFLKLFKRANQSTPDIFFRTSGNSYFNGGNVGIGTITPTEKFTVNGRIKIGDNATLGNAILESTSGNGLIVRPEFNISDTTAVVLEVQNNAGAALVSFKESGNVGIGITTPLAPLHILDGSGGVIYLQDTDAGLSQLHDIASNSNNFQLGTRTSAGAFVDTFYKATGSASGTSIQQWNILGVNRMTLNASGVVVDGNTTATSFIGSGSQLTEVVKTSGTQEVGGFKRFTNDIALANTDLINTLKIGRLDGYTYAQSSRFIGMYLVGLSGSNNVVIGGGTGGAKSATQITLATNSDPESLSSTNRVLINHLKAEFFVPIIGDGSQLTGVASEAQGVLADNSVQLTGETSQSIEGRLDLNDGGNSVFIGTNAGLNDDRTGNNNVGIGHQALYANTSGFRNAATGYLALRFNTTGYSNTANGFSALYANTTGFRNAATGYLALNYITSGYFNTANGSQAGRFTNSGAANETSNSSVYIGYDTKALASGDTNEIVIGSTAEGKGSNTVTLGNDSITDTYLKGKVRILNELVVGSALGDIVSLFADRIGATNMYGFGVESGTLYYKSGGNHDFYRSKNRDGTPNGTLRAGSYSGDGSLLTGIASSAQGVLADNSVQLTGEVSQTIEGDINVVKNISNEYSPLANSNPYQNALLEVKNTNTTATSPYSLIHFRLDKNGGDGYLGFVAGGLSNEEIFIIGNQVKGEMLRIAANGNLGIGTTTPLDKLHVNGGDIRITDTFPSLILDGTTGGNVWSFIEVASGNLEIRVNNLQKLFIDASGNTQINGNVTATSFIGSGSALTGVASSAQGVLADNSVQLTGDTMTGNLTVPSLSVGVNSVSSIANDLTISAIRNISLAPGASGSLFMPTTIANGVNNVLWSLGNRTLTYTQGTSGGVTFDLPVNSSLKLNPNGGFIPVGKTTATEMLDVNGNVKAKGAIIGDDATTYDLIVESVSPAIRLSDTSAATTHDIISNNSELRIYGSSSISLFAANTKKATIDSNGATIFGDVNATNFIGSGSQLTGVVKTTGQTTQIINSSIVEVLGTATTAIIRASSSAGAKISLFQSGETSFIQSNKSTDSFGRIVMSGSGGQPLEFLKVRIDGSFTEKNIYHEGNLASSPTGVLADNSVQLTGDTMTGSLTATEFIANTSNGIVSSFTGTGATARIIIDSQTSAPNTGIQLRENNSAKWSIASYAGGRFTFYNETISKEAIGIDASNNVVFNDGSYDSDFRIESNINQHALFLRGSDGNVGIGTSNPTEKLEVNGNVKATDFIGSGSQLTGIAKTAQSDIIAATTLSSASNGEKIFLDPPAAIDINIDHLELADKQENYFINESAFNVTFVPSVANSTNVIAANALILGPNGTAYLIRKGSENKIYLNISN
jgi:hypothetical protein